MRDLRFIGRSALGATVAALISVAGAVGPSNASTFRTTSDYLAQKVRWSSCGSPGTNLFCGSVTVPLDWSKPAGATINLAVDFRQATATKPLGSVIFNPGGPGASGYDYLQSSSDTLGTAALRANYNFVGFDPRGVQHSTPAVHCFVPGIGEKSSAMDKFLYGNSGYAWGSAKDVAASRAELKKFATACKSNTGVALKYLDTVSTARDLDVLRAVMGDEKLNYLGYSYGTFIGETYASLFPSKVGRMVLDGIVDPTVKPGVDSLNQLKGFDLALNDYLADCLKSNSCPFTGSVSAALRKIQVFLRGLETKSIPTTDGTRKLTVGMATAGIDMALYSKSYWAYLTAGFKQAFNGDGTTLMRLADFYNDRATDGSYNSNQMEAFIATSCLDSRESSSPAAMKSQNARILKASPVMGRYWQFGGLACAYWPYPAVKQLRSYSAKGSPTIIVVGTTGDPATPYQQAVHVAKSVLANGALITYNGEGHTAYGQGHACVDSAVDSFFVSGTVPAKDPNCR